MVDAPDSKSGGIKPVRVRFSPPALFLSRIYKLSKSFELTLTFFLDTLLVTVLSYLIFCVGKFATFYHFNANGTKIMDWHFPDHFYVEEIND